MTVFTCFCMFSYVYLITSLICICIIHIYVSPNESMSHALTVKAQDCLLRDVFFHSVCPFPAYISAMAGSMHARTRASLHADLQSEIHWEMRDCLTAGFCLSSSASLSAGRPLLTSNRDKLCFREVFGIDMLVLVCNSGQLLLRWHGGSGLDGRGILWALERAWPSHRPPCCLNLPSPNALLTPRDRLPWCP